MESASPANTALYCQSFINIPTTALEHVQAKSLLSLTPAVVLELVAVNRLLSSTLCFACAERAMGLAGPFGWLIDEHGTNPRFTWFTRFPSRPLFPSLKPTLIRD